jgi:UDP-3-O-[3-hydroxymyristoyl] glucosamine N-acyltransferase
VTLQELAERIGGQLDGDGGVEVRGVATLEDAGPGDVAFLANKKYAGQVAATRASAVIAGVDLASAPCAIIRAADPYLAFAHAVTIFAPRDRPAAGVSDLACVDATAVVGPGTHVGPFAYVGPGARLGARCVIHTHAVVMAGAELGDDCLVYPHASIRERCVLGHRVILQNGAVVGSDGYGYAPRRDGSYQKIPQIARVVVEDDVEIGANAAIDRPAVGETRIGAGTKIDNLVQVAHGVRVGRNVMLVSQVGVAGSTTIGDAVILAGQVGVAGHLHIGAGTRATAQTGIPNSLPDGSFVSGYPAIDNRDWLKASAVFKRLPDLRKSVSDLERRLAELEARLGSDPSEG